MQLRRMDRERAGRIIRRPTVSAEALGRYQRCPDLLRRGTASYPDADFFRADALPSVVAFPAGHARGLACAAWVSTVARPSIPFCRRLRHSFASIAISTDSRDHQAMSAPMLG